mgnify:CR=1 FL=1
MLEIYYDGSCPLCRKEIDWYRKRGTNAIFRDISKAENLPDDLNHEEAMARFHARGHGGQLISGGDAFIAVWAQTPGLTWAAALAQPRPIRWLLERLYRLFLPVRPYIQKACR